MLVNMNLTGIDVLPEKRLPRKICYIKTFEYFLLGKELKTQANIAKKQY